MSLHRLVTLALLAAAPAVTACHSEYDLVPLTCPGADGDLYDLGFDAGLVELKADVTCVRDPSDAFVEIHVGDDPADIFVVELDTCGVRRNALDRDMVDLVGCTVTSPYRTATDVAECMPAGSGYTEVRLVVDAGVRADDAVLDDVRVPVRLQPE